jgi:hypothetical protein
MVTSELRWVTVKGSEKVLVIILTGLVLLMAVGTFISLAGEQKTKSSDEGLKKRMKTLRSVPYTMVTSEEVDSVASGVITYKPDLAYPGYNIYASRLSGEAILFDMNGKVVHRWSDPEKKFRVWDHAIMLKDGDLVVIRKFHDILRLDWNSNIVWGMDIASHHEVVHLPDSTFYVVAREVHVHRGLHVRFPSIVRFNTEGDVLEVWSTYENLEEIKRKFDQRSFIDTILDSLLEGEVDPETWKPNTEHAESIKAEIDAWPRRYDQFHLNTITILPPNPLEKVDSRFRQGNLLICFRNVNQIAVLKRDTKEILWVWGEGHLDWPHHPTMVENGNILIFDNGTARKYSRLIEINPITEEIEWEYVADPPGAFYTPEKGSAQRFPNGNTLVCEGDRGRCFEITGDGEMVWEWLNPAVKNKRREQLYRMERIDPSIVEPLLRN